MTRTIRALAWSACAAWLLACGGSDATAPIKVASLALTSSTQTLAAGQTLTLTVVTKDASGNVLSGRTITYSSSDDGKATVSASGIVSGLHSGTATITAASEGQSAQLTITIVPGAASGIVKVSGDAQSAAAGHALAAPLVAQVVDALGNPVAGVTLTFAIAAGGGSLGAASATSGSDGRAQTTWTLGTVAGPGNATATAATLTPATFSATITAGPPASLTKISGDNQTGIVSTALSAPFIIKVVDQYGNVAPGIAVSWTILLGTGTLSTAGATTDATGRAQVSLTIGTGAGTRQVKAIATAISGGTNSTTFNSIAAAPQTRDDWVTYGHDAQRTSASQASLSGPLMVAWRYAPPSPSADPYTVAFNALAAADAAYLQWGSKGTFFGFGTGTDVDRVSPAGARVWRNTSWGADANFGHWGSIFGTKFVYQDDGLGYLDLQTGARSFGTSVDWWGETLPDATGLYISQNWHVDGPQAFVGLLDASGAVRWQQNKFGVGKGDINVGDQSGGLALSKGVLFFDPLYNGSGIPFASGTYALDAQSGTRRSFTASSPFTHLSADANNVYLGETVGSAALVARAQSDLHVVWSAAGVRPGAQAPLLANGLVIVGTNTDIEAFDANTGAKVWSTTVVLRLNMYSRGAHTTYLAAALGSGTLVAAASDGIHIFSLLTGAELWKGAVAGAVGLVHDPIIVNDPTRGPVLYVIDDTGMIALTSLASNAMRRADGQHSPFGR